MGQLINSAELLSVRLDKKVLRIISTITENESGVQIIQSVLSADMELASDLEFIQIEKDKHQMVLHKVLSELSRHSHSAMRV